MSTLETSRSVRRGRIQQPRDARWKQVREYAPTIVTELTVMAGQIVVYKQAAHFLGRQGFSEYALARRAISMIYPIALLGFGVGLPRYMALAAAYQDRRNDRFFGATLWCVGSATAILIALINSMPLAAAYLIYGSAAFKTLVFPMSLIIAGLAIHAIVYSYFRGNLQMARANTLQLLNLAAVPLLSFFGAPHNAGAVLTRIGFLSTCVSLSGLLFLTPWQQICANSLNEAQLLLRYGAPRMLGDFALLALLGLPAFWVAHQFGVQEAGSVAFGMSLLGMIGAVFAPLGLILLPKASGLIARGAREELGSHTSAVFQFSFFVSMLLTLLIEIWAGPLLRIYLGRGFSEISTTVRIVMLGAVPYAIYTSLRSAIDARHFKAINTRNCLIALAILVLGSGLLSMLPKASAVNLVLPLPLSLFALGLMTWSQARKVASGLDLDSLL
jgi:O-antigen/teichoic acid export membrane protein